MDLTEATYGERFTSAEPVELPSPNDLAVLEAMRGTDAQNFSFQGMRRKLGLHQETLSRALHRLRRDGFIERLDHAYRISQKGLFTISAKKNPADGVVPREQYSIPLLQSVLPADLDRQRLIESMSFRWFGNLRWLGSADDSGTTTLSWITDETGLTISVKLKDDMLIIETYPRTSSSISEATRSAFELFDHISRALKNADTSVVARRRRAA